MSPPAKAPSTRHSPAKGWPRRGSCPVAAESLSALLRPPSPPLMVSPSRKRLAAAAVARCLAPVFLGGSPCKVPRRLSPPLLDSDSDGASRDSGIESDLSSPSSRASLAPPSLLPSCSWQGCGETGLGDALWEHLRERHLHPLDPAHRTPPRRAKSPSKSAEEFACRWLRCKVNGCGPKRGDAAARFAWLEAHVRNAHGGPRPFPCMIAGCSARFPSKQTLAAHMGTGHRSPPADRPKPERQASSKGRRKMVRLLPQPILRVPDPAEDFLEDAAVAEIQRRLAAAALPRPPPPSSETEQRRGRAASSFASKRSGTSPSSLTAEETRRTIRQLFPPKPRTGGSRRCLGEG